MEHEELKKRLKKRLHCPLCDDCADAILHGFNVNFESGWKGHEKWQRGRAVPPDILDRLNYVNGILRNTTSWSYYEAPRAQNIILRSYQLGVSVEELEAFAKASMSWSMFCGHLERRLGMDREDICAEEGA